MPDQRAKTSTKQVVKDALTPQRLSLLSWAFTAILFGSVGFASVQFSKDTGPGEQPVGYGQILPPAGDVATTSSIGGGNGAVDVGLMPTVNGRLATGADEVNSSQIETLQREVVALRRRLGALAEQNVSYSRRIAALEKQLEERYTAKGEQNTHMAATQPMPVPGTVKAALPEPESKEAVPAPAVQSHEPTMPAEVSDKAIQKRIESVPAPETVSGDYTQMRRKLQHSGQAALAAARKVDTPEGTYEPVRIADISKENSEPIITGSIAPTEMPEIEAVPPSLIEPSEPVGRSGGSGKSLVSHSNFGAVVGRYPSPDKAAEAWKTFQEKNEERMRDLRPIVSKSDMDGNYALLAGPFGNAADAAVACVRLLEVTGTCHPALYVGDALPDPEEADR